VDCNGSAPDPLTSLRHNILDLTGAFHATQENGIFRILAASLSTANPTANQMLRSFSPPARLGLAASGSRSETELRIRQEETQ
jgi:hypothetical protein